MNFGQFQPLNMMYDRLQNYTNMKTSKHETQTFIILIIMIIHLLLLFDVSSPQVHIPCYL
jgi:hypothetical protein